MNMTTIARKRATEAVPAIAHEPPWRLPPSHHARLAGSPSAVLMRLREEAAAEIDRLLAFLDATEGDIDKEDGGDDEPSLGWTRSGAEGSDDDCELDGEVAA
jgi:hypothetical protein